MDQDSALLLFSGIELHVSADEYLPFEANRNFFLSDRPSQRSHDPDDEKDRKRGEIHLFIEEADLNQERWFGRKVTVSEAQEITGIDDVRFLDSFEGHGKPSDGTRTSEHCISTATAIRSRICRITTW